MTSSAKLDMYVVPTAHISAAIDLLTIETTQVALIFRINSYHSLQFARKTMICSQLVSQLNTNAIIATANTKETPIRQSVIVKSVRSICVSNVRRLILRIIKISSINHYCLNR